jgi:hypothetical protein
MNMPGTALAFFVENNAHLFRIAQNVLSMYLQNLVSLTSVVSGLQIESMHRLILHMKESYDKPFPPALVLALPAAVFVSLSTVAFLLRIRNSAWAHHSL